MSDAVDEREYTYWELGALQNHRLEAMLKSDTALVSDVQFLLSKLLIALPVAALAVVWIVTQLLAAPPVMVREIGLPQVSIFVSLIGFVWLSILLSYAIVFAVNALSALEPIVDKVGWSTHDLEAEMKTEADWCQAIKEKLLEKTVWLGRARRHAKNGFLGAFYMNMAALAGVVGQHFGG